MALQEANDTGRTGQHHCRECGVFFESGKSLEVHIQYHKENLLSKWANQAAAAHNQGDSENNNVKRREFQTAPADSTVLPTGPGRPNSTSGYPGSSSPFQHPHTPGSYTSAPSPYQNDIPSNPGPSPSSTSYGYSNGDAYPVPGPYNGYSRSPRSHPGYYTEQSPQDGYVINAPPDATPHSPSSSSGFRFFNKPCFPLDKNGVSSSSPNTCEKCGCVCESPAALVDHVKVSHPPYGHTSAFQTPDSYYKTEPTHDSPDILDLDCQQKFRPPEEEPPNIPPVSNPHSVSAMLNSWHTPYPVTSSNAPPQPFQNGSSFPPESFPPTNVPSNPAIPTATSPKPTSANSGKGDSWKSNEARRPKTYNCSACNKWFTSSGHLKRHYNTTLHKNAVKQSGKPDPATMPISSHHHPNRDPNYIHSSKTPPGVANPSPNVTQGGGSRPKKSKSISPQCDMGSASPALSSANEGDSSRSGFGSFEMQQQPPPVTQPGFDNGFAPVPEHFDYYRYENRLPQNSTNQISTQPPNYQAGLSVSPSGGLPICPPSHPSLHTPNLLTYMGENIMMPVESGQQLQVLGHPTTTLYTNNLTIIGNQSEPLPSFNQLVTESPYSKPYYNTQQCEYVFVKSEPILDEFEPPPHHEEEPIQESFIKAEDDVDMNNYEDLDALSEREPSPPVSPVQVPTSTIHELESPKPVKKRKKAEVSSDHVTSTSNAKPVIRCDECDKSFNRICYLTQHNKCFHSGVKPYKCERCGKRFHSELRARDHERKHGGVKPYRCEICPKSFNHKTDLRRHLCLHSGQKPFACTSCGKGFIRKDHMLKHMDTHKNNRKRYNQVEFDCLEEDTSLKPRMMVAN